jgi:hypothetical protein
LLLALPHSSPPAPARPPHGHRTTCYRRPLGHEAQLARKFRSIMQHMYLMLLLMSGAKAGGTGYADDGDADVSSPELEAA